MSHEEKPVEPKSEDPVLIREPQLEQTADTPWYVPDLPSMDDLVGDRQEPYETLEPIEPLNSSLPNLVDAFADSLTVPTIVPEELMSVSSEEANNPQISYPAQVLRPVIKASIEACPFNYVGICVNCNDFPCKYILGRVLRFLVAQVEYGS